ncbi:MAG: hypothetical protein KDC98_05190 [Planctomycetes bacterium]|nr:hypothetical protein [Planctomycetota bacterium]
MTDIHPVRTAILALGLATTISLLTGCGEQATAANPPAHERAPGSTSAPGQRDGAAVGAAAPVSAAPTDPPADRVRILVSGTMLGRLEPCGCASGQLGGLPRRMQHIAEQRNYDVMLEGGDLVGGTTELDLLKASTALLVLFQMQHAYDALGIGRNDLSLPLDEWIAMLGMAPGGIVASDLTCKREDWVGLPFVEKTVREQRIRIASFTSRLPENTAADSPFEIIPPAKAWELALAGAAEDTLRVLMLHDTDTVARKLIPGLQPRPDLVICFDQSYTEPGPHPELVAGVPLVFPGIRGRVLLALTLTRANQVPQVGYDLVPLPASKTAPGGGGDPDVKQMLLGHRQDVADNKVLQRMAEQRPTANGAKYLGNASCAGCHQEAMKAWQKSAHAHAWQTLVDGENDPKRYGWPVTKYPDCVGCHVVGYGEKTGFVDDRRTRNLWDVGCERCHGPGSKHAENPAGNVLGLIGGAPASMLCVQCHDFEQSPDFLYGERWPLIEHGREPHMPPKSK